MSNAGSPPSFRTGPEVSKRYNVLAPLYDAVSAPYAWIGGRRLQRKAIAALDLQAGDTVVDLATGSGWNLPSLSAAVGPTGRVVGVDISEGMLRQAQRRADANNLGNVELHHGDMRDAPIPAGTAAVICCFAMEMVPDHDEVIARVLGLLPAGARFALVGLREPSGWPEWLIRVNYALNAPFGIGPDHRDITPWTSLERHVGDIDYEEALGGTVYMAVGRPLRSAAG